MDSRSKICFTEMHQQNHKAIYSTIIFFFSNSNHLGDNCIQIFYLGRYIVGYTVGNLFYGDA